MPKKLNINEKKAPQYIRLFEFHFNVTAKPKFFRIDNMVIEYGNRVSPVRAVFQHLAYVKVGTCTSRETLLN